MCLFVMKIKSQCNAMQWFYLSLFKIVFFTFFFWFALTYDPDVFLTGFSRFTLTDRLEGSCKDRRIWTEREKIGRRKKGMYRESDPCFPAAECLYPLSVKEHLSVFVGHSFPCFLSSVSSFISVLDGKHHSLLSFLSFSTAFNKWSNNKTCGASSLVRIRTGWFGTKEREWENDIMKSRGEWHKWNEWKVEE